MVNFQNLSKNGEMLKNVGENIKKCFAVIFFDTMDIKNTIFNPKFYQHFLPSLLISIQLLCAARWEVSPLKCAQPHATRLYRVAAYSRIVPEVYSRIVP